MSQFDGLSIRVALLRTRKDREITGRFATSLKLNKRLLLGTVYDIELQCARQRWRRKKLSRLIAGRSIARRTSAIDIPGEKNSGTLHSRNENIAVVVYNKDAINCNSGGLSPSIFVRLRVHRAQCQGDRSLPVAER